VAGFVVGEPVEEVSGPPGVVGGVPVWPVEMQEVDGPAGGDGVSGVGQRGDEPNGHDGSPPQRCCAACLVTPRRAAMSAQE